MSVVLLCWHYLWMYAQQLSRTDGGAGNDYLDGGSGTDSCARGETTAGCETQSGVG